MKEIIGLEAQVAPSAVDQRVGFAVTHIRAAINLQFPVDEMDDTDDVEYEQAFDQASKGR